MGRSSASAAGYDGRAPGELEILADSVWSWAWVTGTAVLLALAIMALGGLAVTERDHPANWVGGARDLYTELSGRDVDSGRLSWLSRPEGEINSQPLLVAVVPALVLALLILLAII